MHVHRSKTPSVLPWGPQPTSTLHSGARPRVHTCCLHWRWVRMKGRPYLALCINTVPVRYVHIEKCTCTCIGQRPVGVTEDNIPPKSPGTVEHSYHPTRGCLHRRGSPCKVVDHVQTRGTRRLLQAAFATRNCSCMCVDVHTRSQTPTTIDCKQGESGAVCAALSSCSAVEVHVPVEYLVRFIASPVRRSSRTFLCFVSHRQGNGRGRWGG